VDFTDCKKNFLSKSRWARNYFQPLYDKQCISQMNRKVFHKYRKSLSLNSLNIISISVEKQLNIGTSKFYTEQKLLYFLFYSFNRTTFRITFNRDYELGPPKYVHPSRPQRSKEKSKAELRSPDFSLVSAFPLPCSLLKKDWCQSFEK